MAQKSRQNKLFAAEDFTVVYESYINANFQAFDYDTIRTAMVEYVRNTYPENYNDWVESAEFVSLLDVVAQFGHNLAYRVDINARNNFLSTSRRKESVYKLAEFLGYQPRRNVPAYGEMKITSVKTNESIVGSAGVSLGGTDILYEVSNNVNNLDDFITVVNAVMENSNQYGSPKTSAVINNVSADFYDLNNTPNQIKYDIKGTVNGVSSNYNIISSEYDSKLLSFAEKSPDPVGSLGIYFKNDGKGINSANTGFYFGVKQGALGYQDFSIDTPIDNLSLDISAANVNNSDIWVQNINSTGNVIKNWKKVTDVNSNVIYNDLKAGERDVFSVKTRTGNKVSIMFADKVFGNIPRDTIRVWYRTSVDSTHVVRPDDLSSQRIQVKYTGVDGNTYTAIFKVQLMQAITNASSSETINEIKENAPKNYASQDRMITGSDYNTLLGNSNGAILKIKSVNRTFSGHSRYSKFMDPTGTYSNLYLSGKDATLYRDNKLVSVSAATNDTEQVIYEKYVKNILDNDEFVNLYYIGYAIAFASLRTDSSYTENSFNWNNPSTTPTGVLTGYITNASAVIQRVGSTVDTYMQYITPGAMIKFAPGVTASGNFVVGETYRIATLGSTPTDFTAIGASANTVGTRFVATDTGSLADTGTARAALTKWAKVVSVSSNGLGIEGTGAQAGQPTGLRANGTGAIMLDTEIPKNYELSIVYPALARKFVSRERDIFLSYLKAKRSFTTYYNFKTRSWAIDTAPDPFVVFLPTASESLVAGIDYIIETLGTTAWSDAGWVAGNGATGNNGTVPRIGDKILAAATNPTVGTGTAKKSFPTQFGNNKESWSVYFNYTGANYDVYLRTMRINFSSDAVKLGNITNELEIGTYTKKAKRDTIGLLGQLVNGDIVSKGAYYVYGFETTDATTYRLSLIDGNADSRPDNPDVFKDTVGITTTDVASKTYSGQSNLNFEWEHIAAENQVVDPSFTNIIDVFALSKSYDTAYKNYLNGTIITEPLPPTSYELGTQFTSVLEKKAVSDTVVFKSVKYKPMFGSIAEPHLRARFRIIKLFGATITDSDLKTKVVAAINTFFDSSNWDFGETFYFTELAAYVHAQLAGSLSSFVIVPQGTGSVFGDLFEYTPNTDELIIPDVDTGDIDIITNITDANIRAGS
jgi:hypothetical protein|tara:strand:- start:2119 stop:5580 length:3462 start_codon:yes stop_codon:yes gene_type:complete